MLFLYRTTFATTTLLLAHLLIATGLPTTLAGYVTSMIIGAVYGGVWGEYQRIVKP